MLIRFLKRKISHFLNMRALNAHLSKLGWRDAPRYTAYLKACQSACAGKLPERSEFQEHVAEFNKIGTTTIWNQDLEDVAHEMFSRITQWEAEGRELWKIPENKMYGAHQTYVADLWKDFPELERAYKHGIGGLLTQIYQAHYKLYFTSMVKSVGVTKEPSGSQQWHNDAGPGSCIIVAMYLHSTDQSSGCLQTLPWEQSIEIYGQERAGDEVVQAKYADEHNIRIKDLDKLTIRSLRHEYYENVIQSKFKDKVLMPFGKAGSAVLFRNNTLHRGGHPDMGKERYALLMHCYPADVEPPFEHYRKQGLKKPSGYPLDPAF